MEKLQKKKGKGKKGQAPEEKESRRTNSSAKVFANIQKIAEEDHKRRDDKKQQKAKTIKRTYSETQSGNTKKYML